MNRVLPRRKFKRVKKRWTEREVRTILNYVQLSPDLEQPTAQIYYRKLIEKTKIDATWQLIRYKVRHLKDSFKKAMDWRQSEGAQLLDAGEDASSVELKILQRCRYYHQLRDIFDEKCNGEPTGFEIIECGDSNTVDESVGELYNERTNESPRLVESSTDVKYSTGMDFVECRTVKEEVDVSESNETASPTPMADEPAPVQSTSNSNQKEVNCFAKKPKSHASVYTAPLAAFKSEGAVMFKMKFDFEREKYEKEFSISERKMKLEEEKLKADVDLKIRELELKAREIEKDEKLQMLQIEKDERLKRLEIELKYKYENEYVYTKMN